VDLGRLKDLELSLRDAVQLRSRYICLYDEDGASILFGIVLNVGLDYCVFRLRPVKGSDKHTLTVGTANCGSKVYRETRAGWFAVDNIADYVIELVSQESERRGSVSRARQRVIAVTRESMLKVDGPIVEVETNKHDNTRLDLTLRGMPEDLAGKIVDYLWQHVSRKVAQKTIWEEILDSES
jgi:hypothetical protein